MKNMYKFHVEGNEVKFVKKGYKFVVSGMQVKRKKGRIVRRDKSNKVQLPVYQMYVCSKRTDVSVDSVPTARDAEYEYRMWTAERTTKKRAKTQAEERRAIKSSITRRAKEIANNV